MAPIVHELAQCAGIRSRIVVTAQHREMLDQVLDLFEITPDGDLNIMTERQTLAQITNRALSGLVEYLGEEQPDLVLVQGDTTTVLAAGLAAYYQKIPVGHVEAGLRTETKYAPFPEEMNRRLTSVLADLHFAPTRRAVQNLQSSGADPRGIFLTGNTITDALMSILRLPFRWERTGLPFSPGDGRVLLVEVHRRENLGPPLRRICEAVKRLADSFRDILVVFSVHRNPAVREVVFSILSGVPRVYLCDPFDYEVLINIMKESFLVLTDSGGMQEEAPSLGKPVLVLRETTERPEGVDAGIARVLGSDADKIYQETARLLSCSSSYEAMARVANPYGDGKAAKRTISAILYYFGITREPPEPFEPG
ncbi:MAG: UDP-N-acetylglucosamine 2-epimerase (non-hydrolyzing) [Armatimonadetes bacterium]|nr:UDP-N-acetylglucosamine 2-epimerase (non-hydrolyzing) [Armatimonadota bacterium]